MSISGVGRSQVSQVQAAKITGCRARRLSLPARYAAHPHHLYSASPKFDEPLICAKPSVRHRLESYAGPAQRLPVCRSFERYCGTSLLKQTISQSAWQLRAQKSSRGAPHHGATKPPPADLNLLSADNEEPLQTAGEEPLTQIELSASDPRLVSHGSAALRMYAHTTAATVRIKAALAPDPGQAMKNIGGLSIAPG